MNAKSFCLTVVCLVQGFALVACFNDAPPTPEPVANADPQQQRATETFCRGTKKKLVEDDTKSFSLFHKCEGEPTWVRCGCEFGYPMHRLNESVLRSEPQTDPSYGSCECRFFGGQVKSEVIAKLHYECIYDGQHECGANGQ